jgi:hypothetical protein
MSRSDGAQAKYVKAAMAASSDQLGGDPTRRVIGQVG